ncbi:MAG: hypothetical protein ABUK01_05220 [Leptospirales bacterium]
MKQKARIIRILKLSILTVFFCGLSGLYSLDTGHTKNGYTITKKNKKRDKHSDKKNKSSKKVETSGVVILYEGHVDGIPVTMFLQKKGNEIIGFYFYRWARPLILRGEISDDNTFFLDEYVGAEVQNAFDGKIDGTTLSGKYGGYTSFEVNEVKKFESDTKVISNERFEKLMGEHLLSLQWISWDFYGNISVVMIGGKVIMYGQQFNFRGDSLVIAGLVTEINDNSFTLNGTVSTQLRGIAKGENCTRDGELTFSIYPNGAFWRLKQMENPCDNFIDYIDIYFKRPASRYNNENLYILD